ncbi:MAG: hypothetical protein Q8J97_04495 [Flavobacteriaceae bacterium]|nr:hypothetical protein [Flavobacteriaceae bacterium]
MDQPGPIQRALSKPHTLVKPTFKKFLCAERQDEVNMVIATVSSYSIESDSCSKRPYLAVVSAPRQGKSRLLDEMARTINSSPKLGKRYFPIVLGYNSWSCIDGDDLDTQKMVPRFCARVLHSALTEPGDGGFERFWDQHHAAA